jgi:hypothetical protein
LPREHGILCALVNNQDRAGYEPNSAKLAVERMVDFLQKRLKLKSSQS